jgi:hypothetical protein
VSRHSFLEVYGSVVPDKFKFAKSVSGAALEAVMEKGVCPVSRQTSADAEQPHKGDLFLFNDWRSSLCQCVPCMNRYSQDKIVFLLDEDEETFEPQRDPRAGMVSSSKTASILY